ncbi:MAG: type II toxin-antitoxin system death-on-curing family toxin [Puniceicoccales bacterium]|jgi:death-on-curing family protein|nr:type II toxin-antitoxin system death-on-curing family toxin [Puniceicoccales bacterium]
MGLKFVSIDDVIVLHRHAIEHYGGLDGIRDMAPLQSAVTRPISISNYDESSDIYNLAAALTSGIIQNHPFNDGNKRAGLLAGLLILERNGKIIGKLHVEKWYTIVVGLATHKISEQQFAGWLRKNFE